MMILTLYVKVIGGKERREGKKAELYRAARNFTGHPGILKKKSTEMRIGQDN